MHFRQKLTFMALGSILTLAGYLLPTLAGDVTAQPKPETKNATFDRIICQSLEVVDKEGIPVVEIDAFPLGGVILVNNDLGKAVVEIGSMNVGFMKVNHTSGLPAVGIGISREHNEGLVSVLGKNAKGQIVLGVDEYGGRVDIHGKADHKSRVTLGINERGHGTLSLWDKNGYRTFP